jgi:hypothetical protein
MEDCPGRFNPDKAFPTNGGNGSIDIIHFKKQNRLVA